MKRVEKIIAIILIVLLIISLVPMIIIAKYNHSCADDYTYGLLPHKTWEETGSFIEVIKAGIEHMIDYYQNWQGTFSGLFIMAMQPAIYGENFYKVTTVFLLFTFILANLFLTKVVFKDYLKLDKWRYLILTTILLILSIQFMPSPVQGFYWYNGAIYYTFFYSIMLILIACILKLFKEEKKAKRIIYTIIIDLLAFILGGSNYITALATNVILFVLVAYSVFTHKKERMIIIGALLFGIIGLGISISAPGNLIRQASIDEILERPGVIKSILYSFSNGAKYLINWINLIHSILFISVLPIFYNITKQMKYKFSKPVLITILSFCIFCTQFTPHIFAQGVGIFQGRIRNIIYFSSIWLVGINLFYYVGWLTKRKNENWTILGVIPISLVLVVASLFGNMEYKLTSIEAMKSLINGEAQRYDREINDRMEIYLDKNVLNVKVPELTVKPYVLFFDDITIYKNDWRNKAVQDFFNKESVVLIKKENGNDTN